MKKITLMIIVLLGMHNINAQIVEDTTLQHFDDGSTSIQISYVDCSNVLTDLYDLIELVQNGQHTMEYQEECMKRQQFINDVFGKALAEKHKTKNHGKLE